MNKHRFTINKTLLEEIIEIGNRQAMIEYEMIDTFEIEGASFFGKLSVFLENLRIAKLLRDSEYYTIEFSYLDMEAFVDLMCCAINYNYIISESCEKFYYKVCKKYDKDRNMLEAMGHKYTGDYMEEEYQRFRNGK